MKNHICGIMVTYNPDEDLAQNISTYINQIDKLIIVDNGSKNIEQLKQVEKQFQVSVIYNSENLGIAKALNIGIKEALAEEFAWVLLLDDDSKATPNMINKMLETYDSIDDNEKVVSIFPEITEEYIEDGQKNKTNESSNTYEYVLVGNSSGNLINSKIFNEVGFLRDDFFIDSVDNEFCLRIGKHGYKCIMVKGAFLIHNLGLSQHYRFLNKNVISTNHSSLRRYYIARNRIVLWRMYFSKYPKYVLKDLNRFIGELVKILLYEEKKAEKINMSFKGIGHGVVNKLGKYK